VFPEYTFEVTQDMINKPRNDRNGFAVCHMVQQFYQEDVITRTGASLKKDIFEKVIEHVKEIIFG
jgi:hypothetical protein